MLVKEATDGLVIHVITALVTVALDYFLPKYFSHNFRWVDQRNVIFTACHLYKKTDRLMTEIYMCLNTSDWRVFVFYPNLYVFLCFGLVKWIKHKKYYPCVFLFTNLRQTLLLAWSQTISMISLTAPKKNHPWWIHAFCLLEVTFSITCFGGKWFKPLSIGHKCFLNIILKHFSFIVVVFHYVFVAP